MTHSPLRYRLILIGIGTVVFLFSSCSKDFPEPGPESEVLPLSAASSSRSSANTLLDFIQSSLDLSSFAAAIQKTGQAELFNRVNLDATVITPTDDAFALLPPPFNNAQNISNITDPKVIFQLRQIIRYHILRGARNYAQLTNGPYNTYAAAPTNGSDRVYVGHTVTDLVYFNGRSEIIAIDIQTTNGTIQVINRVLFPPGQDLGQTVLYDGQLGTLAAALHKTGLIYTLFSPLSDFTLFAPSDSAFSALPPPLNNAANISAIPDSDTTAINALRNTLLYHLAPGRIFSVDFRDGNSYPSALANAILSSNISNGLTVQGTGNATASNMIRPNLLARNGVVHVIDQVLQP